MKVYAGTSGFSYQGWKGSFYPDHLPTGEMLRYYAERLPAVEINNTFYRLPKESMLAAWAEEVPPGFLFALKASQYITHSKRLAAAGPAIDLLLKRAGALGEHQGPILFQLPANLTADLPLLQAFLELLPRDILAAFEFRHPSWSEPAVLTALRDRGCALCIADTDEEPVTAVDATAEWGYLRLRRESYDAVALTAWAERIAGQPWQVAYVFFKHETAEGPRLAASFLALQRAAERP
jgi:uncharacterized protein YecE (DUF72 family)